MTVTTTTNTTTSTTATTEQIRARFPAMARVHNGHPVAYFDGPGGTQVPKSVVDAMGDYLLHHNANTHWVYPTSVETDLMLDSARLATADFLNAKASEVAFGNNMTTLTFHLARALSAWWGPGDEIVITDLDHHANVAPWLRLIGERGVTVKSVEVNLRTGQLDFASLAEAITPRTKLLAIGAGSNAIGTISDVARAGAMAHRAGALVFVDAVHYAPHALVDVQAMDCDFLACSSYKFYGPHAGVLFGRQALIEALNVPRLDPAPDWSPERLETGTQNHEGIVGTGAAVDFLASLSEGATRREKLQRTFHTLHERGQALVERLWSGLSGCLHAEGPLDRLNRKVSRRARDVRVQRRLLRRDRHRAARPGEGRRRAGGVFLLHLTRRSRTAYCRGEGVEFALNIFLRVTVVRSRPARKGSYFEPGCQSTQPSNPAS